MAKFKRGDKCIVTEDCKYNLIKKGEIIVVDGHYKDLYYCVKENGEGVSVYVEDLKPYEPTEVEISRIVESDKYDYVNPNHYKKGNKEVYEMMIDIWGKEAFINHCEMCSFKYRMRLGSKPDQPIERDLSKAQWYEEKAKQLKTKNMENLKKGIDELS